MQHAVVYAIRHPFQYMRLRIEVRRWQRTIKEVCRAIDFYNAAEARWGGEPPWHCKESPSGLEDPRR